MRYGCAYEDCPDPYGFASREEQRRHMSSHQANEFITYLCHHDECGRNIQPKFWNSPEGFRRHLYTAHAVKAAHLSNYVTTYGPTCHFPNCVLTCNSRKYPNILDQDNGKQTLTNKFNMPEPVTTWACHVCGWGGQGTVISITCPECGHPRCCYCKVTHW